MSSETLQTDEDARSNSTAVNSVVEPQEEAKVTWDGPNDPANPQNLSFWHKVFLTGLVNLLTINATFASSAPSVATSAIEVHFDIPKEVSLLVTSLFLLGFVFGPLLWSGLSELYGRRPVFISSLLIYTLFLLGQSLAHNIQTLLVTRFLCGFFVSAPLSNAGGFIADIWGPLGRGPAVAIFTAVVFLGPVMGPIVASFVVQSSLGWRWVFWVLMFFSAFCWVLAVVFLQETFAPVLLAKKARLLRAQNPALNLAPPPPTTARSLLSRTILRPFKILLLEPILLFITLYLSLVYGLIYALLEVFPILFIEIRGIKPQLGGLMFIGVGLGTAIGAAIAIWLGRDYQKLVGKWRGFPPPEERLWAGMIGGPILVVAIFWLGWTGAYKEVGWYVVELNTVLLGVGIVLVFISFQTYIVDTYLTASSSAIAANSMLRSLAGAAFPLFTNQMFHNLGVQWAATLLGGIALLLSPMPFLFWRYGAMIRTKSRFAPCIDLKIKAEIEREEKRSNPDMA